MTPTCLLRSRHRFTQHRAPLLGLERVCVARRVHYPQLKPARYTHTQEAVVSTSSLRSVVVHDHGCASIRPYVLPSISRNRIPSSVRMDLQCERGICPAGVSDFLAALPVEPAPKPHCVHSKPHHARCLIWRSATTEDCGRLG